jgi:hypothetical protein
VKFSNICGEVSKCQAWSNEAESFTLEEINVCSEQIPETITERCSVTKLNVQEERRGEMIRNNSNRLSMS